METRREVLDALLHRTGEVHLVTTGTSILRNAAMNLKEPCSGELQRYLRGELPKLSKACRDEMYRLLAIKPYEMSAELNAMRNILDSKRHLRLIEKIILYCTDTPPGATAAELISEYLKSLGLRVETKVVPNLGKNFQEGVINLVKMLVNDIRKNKQNYVVYLNLTGGFKPESGAAIIAGSIAGAHAAYYIHEYMKTPVWIPLLPLRLDKEELQGCIDTLHAYMRCLEMVEAAGQQKMRMVKICPWYVGSSFALLAAVLSEAETTPDGCYKVPKEAIRRLERFIKGFLEAFS